MTAGARTLPERILDAHHHVWGLGVRDQEWISGPRLSPLRRNFTIDRLRPQAAAAGVRASVLVQTVCVPGEAPELLALAAGRSAGRGTIRWPRGWWAGRT